MERVRIGLRGCGLVALRVHLPNRRRLPGAAIVAAFDDDPRRLERARALAPELATFTDERAFLASGIDAVVVGMPYEDHGAAAAAALAAGRHVYVEKPFAATMADAEAMAAAARASDRVAFVGFNYRYNPLVAELRRRLDRGAIGRPVSIRTTLSFPPHDDVDWQLTRHGQWGALFDAAPHHLDLLRFLTGGEAERVTAELCDADTPRDTAHIQVRMAGGVLAQLCLQLSSIEEHRIEAHGTAGKLTADVLRSMAVEFTPPRVGRLGPTRQKAGQLLQPLTRARYLLEKLAEPWNEPSFRRAMAAFVRIVNGSREPYPGFEDGLACQRLMEAAGRSLAVTRRQDAAA